MYYKYLFVFDKIYFYLKHLVLKLINASANATQNATDSKSKKEY